MANASTIDLRHGRPDQTVFSSAAPNALGTQADHWLVATGYSATAAAEAPGAALHRVEGEPWGGPVREDGKVHRGFAV
jgi:hypothetical protein